MSTEERELLTPQEVSELLRIPLATLQTWRSNRTGPTGYRVGRHIRYDRADVESWLQERRGYVTPPKTTNGLCRGRPKGT